MRQKSSCLCENDKGKMDLHFIAEYAGRPDRDKKHVGNGKICSLSGTTGSGIRVPPLDLSLGPTAVELSVIQSSHVF